MNNNGSSSAIISRQDFLPFGEQIWSGVGLRTSSQAYASTNAIRQKYGLTQRDEATGLDHASWRKYESLGGRWTSPDPLHGRITAPQSFNAYAYVGNDPVNFVDPPSLEGDAIDDAVAGATVALQSGSCRSMFKGTDPIKLLNFYANRGNGVLFLSSGSTPWGRQFQEGDIAVTNTTTGQVAFNANSWFVTGMVPIQDPDPRDVPIGEAYNFIAGMHGLSLHEARTVALLHELLHVVGGIPHDTGNIHQSLLNTAIIRLNCMLFPINL
jgi:RHS repeat-associated protein